MKIHLMDSLIYRTGACIRPLLGKRPLLIFVHSQEITG